MKFHNPVISGFYPDPSICRVGEDYYLATSSFEYFPGVPIFHSRDLVHWRQIGHALTRRSQLLLDGIPHSLGIHAPSLRYRNGLFYLITTNHWGTGHFYVTTEDPTAEWSEPTFVEGPGFDPDIFWDDDGRVYWMREDITGYGIRMWEMEIQTGWLIGAEHLIWEGLEDRLCEAPHIYKIGGTYYLLVAEGGTHRGHMAVVARASSVIGPYESCPHNPILSHRGHVAHPIQATGHGDLVQAHDGSWWMVFLGIRQAFYSSHHLGRETFLAPVTWDENGWPWVNEGQPIELEMDAPNLPPHPWPPEPVRDDFDAAKLGVNWTFRRNPEQGDWSLTERSSWLGLRCSERTLAEGKYAPSFIGRRQRHFECRATVSMDFTPAADGEEAGLTTFMNERHHYEIAVTRLEGQRTAIVRQRIGDLESIVARHEIAEGMVQLQIQAEKRLYTYRISVCGGPFLTLATADPHYLSSEVAGGFTGVFIAMYATAHGQTSQTRAWFDWFDYEETISTAAKP